MTEKDSRTLVIVAHPDLRGKSRANKRWVEELERHPEEFVVHDLFAAQRAGAGATGAGEPRAFDAQDVAREQALLAAHDLIVFQFPVFWYSCPPLLRAWEDAVYSLGWAYGNPDAQPGGPGRALAGKRFAYAVTAGDIEEHYCATGPVGCTLDEALVPFRATAKYLEVAAEPHAFAIYGADFDLTDEQIAESAPAYVKWLRDLRK